MQLTTSNSIKNWKKFYEEKEKNNWKKFYEEENNWKKFYEEKEENNWKKFYEEENNWKKFYEEKNNWKKFYEEKNNRKNNRKHKKQEENITSWMTNKAIPKGMKSKILDHIHKKFQLDEDVCVENLIPNLPSRLQGQVKHHICFHLLKKVRDSLTL